MGQRFQIVVKFPENGYTRDNPNWKGEQYFVLHSQWMYGTMATWYTVNLAKGLIKTLKTTEKYNKKHGFKGYDYQQILEIVNNHFRYKKLGHDFRVYRYYGGDSAKTENDNEILKKYKTFEEFANSLDNNNGVCVIEITRPKKHKLRTLGYFNPEFAECNDSRKMKFLDIRQYLQDYNENSFDKEDQRIIKMASKLNWIPTIEFNFIFLGVKDEKTMS